MLYIYDSQSFHTVTPVIGMCPIDDLTRTPFNVYPGLDDFAKYLSGLAEKPVTIHQISMEGRSTIDGFAKYITGYINNGGSVKIAGNSYQYNIDLIDNIVKSAKHQILDHRWQWVPEINVQTDHHIVMLDNPEVNDYIVYKFDPFELTTPSFHNRLIIALDIFIDGYVNIHSMIRNAEKINMTEFMCTMGNFHMRDVDHITSTLIKWIKTYPDNVVFAMKNRPQRHVQHDDMTIIKLLSDITGLSTDKLGMDVSLRDIELHDSDTIYQTQLIENELVFDRIIIKPYNVYIKEDIS